MSRSQFKHPLQCPILAGECTGNQHSCFDTLARNLNLVALNEKTILIAFAEVDNSLAEIRTFTNEFAARQTQVIATERSLLLSRALYDNGYTSFLQVLDAEREFYTASFEKSLALQSQLISTVRLYKALGGGW